MEVSYTSEECGQMVQLMRKTFSLSELVPLKLWGGQETVWWDPAAGTQGGWCQMNFPGDMSAHPTCGEVDTSRQNPFQT